MARSFPVIVLCFEKRCKSTAFSANSQYPYYAFTYPNPCFCVHGIMLPIIPYPLLSISRSLSSPPFEGGAGGGLCPHADNYGTYTVDIRLIHGRYSVHCANHVVGIPYPQATLTVGTLVYNEKSFMFVV